MVINEAAPMHPDASKPNRRWYWALGLGVLGGSTLGLGSLKTPRQDNSEARNVVLSPGWSPHSQRQGTVPVHATDGREMVQNWSDAAASRSPSLSFNARAAFANWLNADARAAMEFLSSLVAQRKHPELVRQCLGVLVEKQPEAALALLRQVDNNDSARFGWDTTVYQELAKNGGVESVRRMLAGLSEKDTGLQRSLLLGLAAKEPMALNQFLEQVSLPSRDRAMLLSTAILTAIAQVGPQATLESISRGVFGEANGALMIPPMQRWVAENPTTLFQWISNIEDVEVQNVAITSAVGALEEIVTPENYSTYLDWIESQVPQELQGRAHRQMLGKLGRENIEAARKYVQSVEQARGPQNDLHSLLEALAAQQ